jgi:hypothetical protein
MDDQDPKEAFLEGLCDCLGVVKALLEAFDAGHSGEAGRLAGTLRSLFLGTVERERRFHDLGLLFSDCTYHYPVPDVPPPFDPSRPRIWTYRYFGRWWHIPMFRDDDGSARSRRDVIVQVSERDSVSSTSQALDVRFASVMNALGPGQHGYPNATGRPIGEADRLAIRQISYEVLFSLDPDFRNDQIRRGVLRP